MCRRLRLSSSQLNLIRSQITVALACTCLAQSASADCPGPEDRATGFVVETRGGDGTYNVIVRDDDTVWAGYGSGGRLLTPDSVSFERVTDRGLLITETENNALIWTDYDDLTVLNTLPYKETVEIHGTVSLFSQDSTRAAVARFRNLGEEDLAIGDCTYRVLKVGANSEAFNADGSSDRLPGYFTYVPDLMIALTGMWDAGIYGVTDIRKATDDDWFRK